LLSAWFLLAGLIGILGHHWCRTQSI